VSTAGANLVLNQLPKAVEAQARQLGLTDEDCLFGVCTDLTLSALPHDVWLIVTQDQILTINPEGEDGDTCIGPFALKEIESIRSFQAVGSAFLQLQMGDMTIDLARYSNGYRELVGRARTQIDNLIKGEPYVEEDLIRGSDTICEKCGLPVPGRGQSCRRCADRGGIFWRSAALMQPYRGYIVLLMAMMVAGVGIGLVPPQLHRILIDQVLSKGMNQHWLKWILLGLFSVALGRAILNVFIGRISNFVGTKITRELRERLQKKFLTLGVDYYDRNSTGQLMSRVLHDVDFFQQFVQQMAQGFLLNCMLVIGIGTILFFMHPWLAFLVMLPIPGVAVGTYYFYKHVYPLTYRRSDSRAKMSRLLNGLLSGIRLVKAFGQEKREKERFTVAATYMQDSIRGVQMKIATFNPTMAFVFNLGGLLIWYVGGETVLDKKMSLGTLVAFATYLSMFYQPIQAMSVFSNWVTSFMSAGQRVFEVLDAVPSIRPSAQPVAMPDMKGAIEFRNVTFGYDPYNPILRNVSMTIEPGQFIGICGRSGAGKSTLINLICRFYDPQRGKVLIDGIDIRDIEPGDLHRQVGLVLQEPFLFRGSIRDNIAYGRPGASPMDIIKSAKSANAHDFVGNRPMGYDSYLGERGAGLSGGERQRISIARAMLCDPRILILDEATSSVDTESELMIQKSLDIMGKGRTTIAIAHRLTTLKNADKIYVIGDGGIAESGSHEELMGKEGLYHNLVHIQTQLASLEG
jgi:ATP-binding cassette, subfamily B, bacterial